MGKKSDKSKSARVGGKRHCGKTIKSTNGTIYVAGRSITLPNGTKITAEGGGVVRYTDGDLDVSY